MVGKVEDSLRDVPDWRRPKRPGAKHSTRSWIGSFSKRTLLLDGVWRSHVSALTSVFDHGCGGSPRMSLFVENTHISIWGAEASCQLLTCKWFRAKNVVYYTCNERTSYLTIRNSKTTIVKRLNRQQQKCLHNKSIFTWSQMKTERNTPIFF